MNWIYLQLLTGAEIRVYDMVIVNDLYFFDRCCKTLYAVGRGTVKCMRK